MDLCALHDGKLLLIQVKGEREGVSIPVGDAVLKVERLLAFKKAERRVFEPVKQ